MNTLLRVAWRHDSTLILDLFSFVNKIFSIVTHDLVVDNLFFASEIATSSSFAVELKSTDAAFCNRSIEPLLIWSIP